MTGTGTGLTIQLGIDMDRVDSDDVLNHNDMLAYNYVRTNSVGGHWGSLCRGCVSIQMVDLRRFANKRFPRDTGRTDVCIGRWVDGPITGLAEYDNTAYTLITSRWTDSTAKWVLVTNDLLTNAQVVFGPGTLNPSPLNQVVTSNGAAGVINDSSEYDDRPILVGMRSYSLTAPHTPGSAIMFDRRGRIGPR